MRDRHKKTLPISRNVFVAPSCDLPFLGLSNTSIKWIDCALLPPPPQAYRTYICGKQGAVFAQAVYSRTHKKTNWIRSIRWIHVLYCIFLISLSYPGFFASVRCLFSFFSPLLELPSTSFPPSFFVTRHKKLLLQKKEGGKQQFVVRSSRRNKNRRAVAQSSLFSEILLFSFCPPFCLFCIEISIRESERGKDKKATEAGKLTPSREKVPRFVKSNFPPCSLSLWQPPPPVSAIS